MTDAPEPPGMIGPSPSERGLPAVPSDPAEHAAQSAREWEDVAEAYVKRRMKELGSPEERIGAIEHSGDGKRHAFVPGDRAGGTCDEFGRLYVDSGVLNPSLLEYLGQEVSDRWAKARLRTRIDCVIPHEDEETKCDHDSALELAADTELPITEDARGLLRLIAEAEKGRRGR